MTTDERATLTHAAASLDEIHGALEKVLATTRTELVLVRLALVREDESGEGRRHE